MAYIRGYWTKGKLDLLRDYLDSFTTATKKAPHRIYLDLFAGTRENIYKDTGESFPGSPEIALTIDDPPFTHLRFIELKHAQTLESHLQARFPNRNFLVHEGDCNEAIYTVLDELTRQGLNRAPTFAFIDPNGPHYHWTTLKALAAHKPKHRSRTKTELWMLFPEPMFVRFLVTDGGKVRSKDAEKITSMYGTERWRDIYQARLCHKDPGWARREYVNLMRWRLENALEYKWTYTFEVHTDHKRPIYHLIFATDNSAGKRIMSHLYNQAVEKFPRMRQHAEDQRTGAARLFGDDEFINVVIPQYKHEPPWEPFSLDENGCMMCTG